MGAYAKAIAAMLGSGLTAAVALYPNATWVPIAIAILTPLTVLAVPNAPKKTKTDT